MVAKQHKPLADALLDAAAELLDISAYPLDTVQRTYDITSVQSSYKHGLLNEEQSLYRSAEEGLKHLYHTCAIECLKSNNACFVVRYTCTNKRTAN